MRLRWQLVVSHLLSIISVAVLIGAVNFALVLRNTRSMELDHLDSKATVAGQLFLQRLANLDRARDGIAAFLFQKNLGASDVEMLTTMHELIELYRVERVEIFCANHLELQAYRWERGSSPSLATIWLPPNPRLAASVTSGQRASWMQRSSDGLSSLKTCVSLPTMRGAQRRWLILTEPLDSTLLEGLLPSQVAGALADERRILVGWPETPSDGASGLQQLKSYLPEVPFSGLFPLIQSRHPIFQLDDGAHLSVILLASSVGSSNGLKAGLQAWFVVAAAGALLAITLGSGLASRLLAPLRALLEGTSAMARGHLMVRLPMSRTDELGALMREFNRMADEIRSTYLGVISTLAEVVEAKSQYTREHIERVERLVIITANALEKRGFVRFSMHQKFVLSVAAILHDVGKIAIANEILNKVGPLDSHELEQMSTHPEVGALIVERIGKLERAAEIIRCAHEHFDGSGYPRGLVGEDIPIESRIILAADAFDAMTMDRPYSVGRPIDEAIAELRRMAGKQFDAVVIEALVAALIEDQGGEMEGDGVLYHALHPETDRLIHLTPRHSRDSQE